MNRHLDLYAAGLGLIPDAHMASLALLEMIPGHRIESNSELHWDVSPPKFNKK